MSPRAAHLSARRPREGLTLIETLLALAIALLVVGLVYSVYHTALRVVSGQEARERTRGTAVEAVSRISAYLAAVADIEGELPPFVLGVTNFGAAVFSELSFWCAVMPDEESDAQWHEMRRTTFRVAADGRGTHSLLCEQRALTGPGSESPAETNILAEGVGRFAVQAYDGLVWADQWPAEGSEPWPQAARIELALGDDPEATAFSAEAFIPVATVVTSSIERIRVAVPPGP